MNGRRASEDLLTPGWSSYADGICTVAVTVPEGAEAVLRLPDTAEETVGAGRHVRQVASGRPGPA
ncbi:hypothetical protein J2X68_002691 [Streptomyces sp. 3330]|nr:hypothetical protein [Streptomyces sp. 3330]